MENLPSDVESFDKLCSIAKFRLKEISSFIEVSNNFVGNLVDSLIAADIKCENLQKELDKASSQKEEKVKPSPFVYLLWFITGEHEDYRETLACIYKDKQQAEAEAESRNAKLKERNLHYESKNVVRWNEIEKEVTQFRVRFPGASYTVETREYV